MADSSRSHAIRMRTVVEALGIGLLGLVALSSSAPADVLLTAALTEAPVAGSDIIGADPDFSFAAMTRLGDVPHSSASSIPVNDRRRDAPDQPFKAPRERNPQSAREAPAATRAVVYRASATGEGAIQDAALGTATDAAGNISDFSTPVLVEGAEVGLILAEPLPGQAGISNIFEVSGAGPGAAILLAEGVLPGASPIPGCASGTFDSAEPRFVGQARADANGNANFIVDVPLTAAGRTLLYQAAERPVCVVSNLVAFT